MRLLEYVPSSSRATQTSLSLRTSPARPLRSRPLMRSGNTLRASCIVMVENPSQNDMHTRLARMAPNTRE